MNEQYIQHACRSIDEQFGDGTLFYRGVNVADLPQPSLAKLAAGLHRRLHNAEEAEFAARSKLMFERRRACLLHVIWSATSGAIIGAILF